MSSTTADSTFISVAACYLKWAASQRPFLKKGSQLSPNKSEKPTDSTIYMCFFKLAAVVQKSLEKLARRLSTITPPHRLF